MEAEQQVSGSDKQQKQGCSKSAFGIAFLVCLVPTVHFSQIAISYIFAGVSSRSDVINLTLSVIGLVATLVGTILTLLAWVVPSQTIRNRLQPLFDIFPKADQEFNAIFGEPSSYLDLPDDRRILMKFAKQLKKWRYLPIPGSWGQSDFDHEMASADQRTKHTLTILSRAYIKKAAKQTRVDASIYKTKRTCVKVP